MRFDFRYITCGAVIAMIIAVSPLTAEAKAKNTTDTQALLNALEKQAKRLEKEERAAAQHQKRIAAERAEFEVLKSKVQALTGVKMNASSQSSQQAATSAQRPLVPAVQNAAIPNEVGIDRKQATPEKPPEVARYIEEGGVLLPKGKLEIAPSLEYNRISATTVAIQGFSIVPALNIGLFDISQVNRDVAIGAVSARLGVTNRIEVDAKVPYVYGKQTTTGRQVGVGASDNTITGIGGQGIGDVEVGVHYQINKGQNGWPYFVGNLRYKAATGTGPFETAPNSSGQQTRLATGSGFAAVQPSVTMIFPSDPVVFYSNLGYVHNFGSSIPSFASGTFGGYCSTSTCDIEPGDSVNASFGMSLAINDAVSMSLGYSHSMVFRTRLNNNFLPGSYDLQVGSLDLGYSYALSDWMSLNVSVSAGLTADAPDDRVVFRVPMNFDLF